MDNGIHIIKASAGSGKTYTLAKDYIKLLLCHESPSLLGSGDKKPELRPQGNGTDSYHSHILAITFTNAATAEMKQRIIDQLYWLGQGDGKRCNYTADFKRELSYNDFGEVQEAARQALSNILFNYNTFNVSTIDSFFQSILRTFARELDCDYDYGIQLDDDLAQSAAINSLLATLGTKGNGYLDEWLSEYIKTQVSEGGNPSVYSNKTKNDLKNMAKELGKEEFSSKHDAIHDYLSDIGSGAGVSRIGRFTKAVAQAINQAQSGILELDAQVSGKMRALAIDGSKIKTQSNMGKVLVAMLTEGDSDDPKRSIDDISHYIDTFCDNNNKKKYPLKKTTFEHGNFFKKGASETDKDKFHNHVLPLIREIINIFTRCDALESAQKNIWKLGLLGKIDDEIVSYRKENNVILLKDTNDMMKKVIDSGVPFMYERVGTWINNFMIDEFQDTSDKQYHNFKELLDESCSSGHNSLIIGDEKQSIYRFRNANPELLLNGIEADFGERCETSSIDHNYRSLSEVVNFNNEFFGKALQYYKDNHDTANYDILQATYRHIEQKPGKKSDDTGYVEFVIGNADASHEGIFSVPMLIEELRERGYRMSDIGILVNERREGNTLVSQILEHNEKRIDTNPKYDPIQIMSAESLKLVNSPQVQLIVGVLRFINASQMSEAVADADDKAAAYRKKQLSDQRLYSIIHDFESKLASYDRPQGVGADRDFGSLLLQSLSADRQMATDIPQEKERMEAYSKKVSGLLPDYRTEPMNLTSIVDRIIKQYVLFGDKKLNERKVGTSFLLAFQNVVNGFVTDSSNCGTIREFLDFWDQKADTLTVPTPSDANAVQIMTIHKSKGLQFKCVIIPFANWKMTKEEETTWITRELWVKTFGTDAEVVPPLVPMRTSDVKGVEQFKQQLDEANQRSLIDNLNKAYVALTRAEREIYVMAFPPQKKAQQPFSDLVARIVLEMDGEVDNSNEDKGMIRWSRGSRPETVEIRHSEAEDQSAIDMPQYYVNIATPELLKVSLPEFTTPEQQAGTSLHRLLSRLGTARDLERTIAFGKSRCIIADHGGQYWNAERMEAAMRRLVGEEPTSEWFAPENHVYNERSITHADRNHNMCHTRPDRVVRRPDGSHIVIDYKTGADESHAMTERYKRQVAGYMRRVAAASGCSQVEGYIIYLQSWHIVKVEI